MSLEQKKYFESGIQAERNRITALIKTLDCELNGVEHDCTAMLYDWSVNALIEFINGEQQ